MELNDGVMIENSDDDPHGYRPRPLNVYESQIIRDWCDDVSSVYDLVDGWVRTVAVETDLKPSQIDVIVERAQARLLECYKGFYAPIAAIEAIREVMTENNLAP